MPPPGGTPTYLPVPLGRLLAGLFLVLSFACGVWLSRDRGLNIPRAVGPAATADGEGYQPQYRRSPGPQLVLVFVGSSSCASSSHPDLPEQIESLKLRLARYAADREIGFRAVAVSVDWIPQAGLEHLARFGAFDEVSVGSNWTNNLLMDYVWERNHAPSTPAIFLYYHNLVMDADEDLGTFLRVGRESRRLLVHRMGLDPIRSLSRLPPEVWVGLEEAHGSGEGVFEDKAHYFERQDSTGLTPPEPDHL